MITPLLTLFRPLGPSGSSAVLSTVQPQGLCTWRSLCLVCMLWSLTSHLPLLRCPFLREAFPDHSVEDGLGSPPPFCFSPQLLVTKHVAVVCAPPPQRTQAGVPSCEGRGLVLFTAVPELWEEGRQEWMKEGMNGRGALAPEASWLIGGRARAGAHSLGPTWSHPALELPA